MCYRLTICHLPPSPLYHLFFMHFRFTNIVSNLSGFQVGLSVSHADSKMIRPLFVLPPSKQMAYVSRKPLFFSTTTRNKKAPEDPGALNKTNIVVDYFAVLSAACFFSNIGLCFVVGNMKPALSISS